MKKKKKKWLPHQFDRSCLPCPRFIFLNKGCGQYFLGLKCSNPQSFVLERHRNCCKTWSIDRSINSDEFGFPSDDFSSRLFLGQFFWSVRTDGGGAPGIVFLSKGGKKPMGWWMVLLQHSFFLNNRLWLSST